MAPRSLPVLLALLSALALCGCASESSGDSAVNARRVVLITAAPAGTADAALACGARAEARRLHESLAVARPARPTASAQILVTDVVTAQKPGGVVIVPVAENPLEAPILSLRRAGIRVVVLPAQARAGAALARRGALAVARVVTSIRGDRSVRVPSPCAAGRS